MAHTGTHAVGEGHVAVRSKLLYQLNDKPPLKDSLFVALQHVCAIFIPVVTPGLLITGALGLEPNKSAYILGMSLFVSGLGTLSCGRLKWIIALRHCGSFPGSRLGCNVPAGSA